MASVPMTTKVVSLISAYVEMYYMWQNLSDLQEDWWMYFLQQVWLFIYPSNNSDDQV
jgi:hypothetical protein